MRSSAPRSESNARRAPAWAAAILAFLCFFPYPAIPVGNVTGIQLSFIACALLAPLAFLLAGGRRGWIAFSVMAGSYLFAACISMVRNSAIIPENLFKAVPVWVLSIMPLLTFAPLLHVSSRNAIFAASAVAIIIHSAFGLIQWVAFGRGIFPFAALFNNRSFSLADNVFLDRPMGYFPEPSSMAASIGPFVLLFGCIMFGGRWNYLHFGLLRPLLVVAGAAGALLVAISKTGYVLPFGALMVCGAAMALAGERDKGVVWWGKVLGMTAVVAGAIALSWASISERVVSETSRSASWSGRLDSITVGFQIWTRDIPTFVWGVGPNQSHLHLEQTGTYQTYGGNVRFGGIISVLVTFLVETGLLGIACVGVVGNMAIRAIRQSSAQFIGLIVFLGWGVAVAFTTNYFILPALWMCLGWLVHWDRLFPMVPMGAARPRPAFPAPLSRRS